MTEQTNSSFACFPALIYKFDLPQYLSDVRNVASQAIDNIRNAHDAFELYPLLQSESIHGNEKIANFLQHVIQLSWDLLNAQGYAMGGLNTIYESMWAQEHHKFSGMEQHTHNNGIQLVGFYFLSVPQKSSKLIFHDPRPAKVQINLPEANIDSLTPASQAINFTPKEGELYFSNSWLPHSFTRHGDENPLQFVHINITVRAAANETSQNATVI